MRRDGFIRPTITAALTALLALPLGAWNDTGHMAVAFIAYQGLTPAARQKVDTLLARHPDFGIWTYGISPQASARRGLTAFLVASTWPDILRGDSRFRADPQTGDTVDTPDSNTLGIPNLFRHTRWHFINQPLTGPLGNVTIVADGGAFRTAPTVLSRIQDLRRFIGETQRPESERAYYLAWLLHLVGDMHQPLHSVARDGDRGGNAVELVGPPDNLHSFWDGVELRPEHPEIIGKLAGELLTIAIPEEDKAKLDEEEWLREGTRLSIELVYRGLDGAPLSNNRIQVPQVYRDMAIGAGRVRIALAGHRLARILNARLN